MRIDLDFLCNSVDYQRSGAMEVRQAMHSSQKDVIFRHKMRMMSV